MTIFSDRFVGSTANSQRTPWLWFLLITFLLLVTQHLFTFAAVMTEERTADAFIEADAGGSVWRRVGYPLLGVAGLLMIIKSGHQWFNWRPGFGALLIVLAAWMVASYTWSIDPQVTMRRLTVYAFFLAGALGVAARWPLGLIVRLFVFCGTIHLGWGLLRELALGRFAPLDPLYRFSGTLDPNHQGQTLAVLVMAAIVASKGSRSRVSLPLIVLCGSALMILTKSRTSVAGFFVALATYIIIVLPKGRRFRLAYAVFMIVLVGVLLVGDVFFQEVGQAVHLGRSAETMSNLTGRIPLWGTCFFYVGQRPYTGFGYEAFWSPEHIDDLTAENGWAIRSAHSAYLELMLSLGFIGVALHSLLLILAVREGCRMYRVTSSPEYALLASLAVALLSFGLLESITVLKDTTPGFFFVALLIRSVFAAPDAARTTSRIDVAGEAEATG